MKVKKICEEATVNYLADRPLSIKNNELLNKHIMYKIERPFQKKTG